MDRSSPADLRLPAAASVVRRSIKARMGACVFDELEVEALELDPVYERESPGRVRSLSRRSSATPQPERPQRPVRRPERRALR